MRSRSSCGPHPRRSRRDAGPLERAGRVDQTEPLGAAVELGQALALRSGEVKREALREIRMHQRGVELELGGGLALELREVLEAIAQAVVEMALEILVVDAGGNRPDREDER